MKFIRLKSVNWMVAMALLALPGALVTSCSKESSPTENVEPKSDQLVISVKGINNQKASAPLRQGLPSKGKAQAAKVAPTVHEFGDVDMAISVGNDLPVKSSVNFASRKGGVAGLRADVPETAVAMEEGLKYVVYVYEGTTFVKSIELAAGTAGTIDGLNPEGQYTWVALSYSSEDDAPALEPGTDIALPLNQDVLYAKGTVDLSTQSTIEILFDHVYSRIGVELNTIGVFGEITGTPQISVTGLNVAAGSLNLLEGNLTPGGTTEASLSWADFQRIDPAYGDQLIAYIYTAPLAAQTAALNIQNLSVLHADIASGSVSRTFFTTPASFALNVTPEAGSSHHLLLNVVESALTDENGIKWGRSNLYYTFGADAPRQYRFSAKNELSNRANAFFAFGSAVPFQFPASSDDFADPCDLVYPQGLWKQPTKADFAGLTSGDIELDRLVTILGPLGDVVDATGVTGLVTVIQNLLSNTVATLVNIPQNNAELGPDPYVYAQYNILDGSQPTSSAFDENSNNLRFFYNGQVTDVTLLQDIARGEGLLGVGLNNLSVDLVGTQLLNINTPLLDSYGRGAALWTSQDGTNILGGVAGLGSWGYYGAAGRRLEVRLGLPPVGLGDRFVMARNTGEALNNLSALGLNALSTSLKNVRCVRAN